MSQFRSVPASHGAAWIGSAINTLRAHPGPITGALSFLTIAVCILAGIQIFAQIKLTAGSTTMIAVQVVTTLAMALIGALMSVGVLRVIDTVVRGGEGRATAVFSVFSEPDVVARTLLFALLVLTMTVALFVVVLFALGPDMLAWYGGVLTESFASVETAAPPIVRSVWLPALLGIVGVVLLAGLNTFGYAQVALTRISAVDAVVVGLQATGRNLMPIIVNMVLTVLLMLVLVIPAVLLMMLFGFIGALVHPMAVAVVVGVMYIAFVIALYALIFGIMYHAWRDVLGEPEAPPGAGDARIASNPGEFTA